LGTIISAALGTMGGLAGTAAKDSAINDKLKALKKLGDKNDNWYNRRYYEDSTQRADAQRLLSLTEEALKRRNKAAAGKAAVMGATEESVAAEKEANNDAYANVVGQIAAAGEQRKERIEQQYQSRKNKLDDEYLATEGERPGVFDYVSAGLAGLQNGLGKGGGMNGSGISGMVSGIGKK